MNVEPYRIARKPKAHRPAGGFTLIETAAAIIIVGLGVAAVLTSAASGSRANGVGKQLTQATFLAQEIREWTLLLPFTDPDAADANNPPGPDGTDPQVFVDDLDDLLGNNRTGVTFDPPKSGRGTNVNDMPGWTQFVDLTWRSPSDLSTAVPDGTSDLVYAEVSILWQGDEVLKTGWLVARKD